MIIKTNIHVNFTTFVLELINNRRSYNHKKAEISNWIISGNVEDKTR